MTTIERPILGLRVGEVISQVHDRAGRYELLTDPTIQYRKRSIEDIWGMLQEYIGVDLPLDLVVRASMDTLKWRQLHHPNALSAFFIGAGAETGDDFRLSQALGIIEIESAVVPGMAGKIYAWRLNLSGVLEDSKGVNRILGVSYDLHTRLATRALVSLREAEIPPLESDYYLREYLASFKKIPYELGNFHNVPTLILTPAMTLQTQHGLAIGTYVPDMHPEEGMIIDANPVITRAGFTARTEGGVNYIGFKQDWEIAYPASL